MCTVSFVPLKDGICITSNRDENVERGNTTIPLKYTFNGTVLTYPKDEKSNGTWIGFNEYNSIAVILNGAFKNHQHQPPYRHSRGLIIPQILSQKNSMQAMEFFSCHDIEPFTLILFYENNLFEFRWNGIQLHKNHLSTSNVYVWNSATLYTNQQEKNNQLALEKTYQQGISKSSIIQFHASKKYEHQLPQNSLINNIKTISITQVVYNNEGVKMQYNNLKELQDSL